MKRQIIGCLVSLGLLLVQASAQSEPELERLESKISRHLETKMPGWRHRRGEPIEGSKGVLTEFWLFSNRIVKTSVVKYDSAQRAQEVLQGFAKYESQKAELKGLGDEAYSWGYGMSDVVFRKGRFIVNVSTYAEVESDPDARTLSQSERSARERSEKKRLSQEFSKHLATAIDLP